VGGITSLISIFNLAIWIGLIALAIYIFILIVKVAKRGIKALDIYIERNQDKL
jgi:hypothetical protein